MKSDFVIFLVFLSMHSYSNYVQAINWDCLLERNEGNCSQSETRYYYDPDKNECSNFTYTGCHGNKNNFLNQSACLNTCSVDSNFSISDVMTTYDAYDYGNNDYTKDEYYDVNGTGDGNYGEKFNEIRKRACRLPFEQNKTDCNKPPQTLYYFDADSNNCTMVEAYCVRSYNFYWNVNECRNICGDENVGNETVPDDTVNEAEKPKSKADCNLPSDTGTCRGSHSKYFYNTESASCELFVWGGCGGNANRFHSREFCEKVCYETHNGTDANSNTPDKPVNKETRNATEENDGVSETPVNKETSSYKYIVILALCAFLLCFIVAFVGYRMTRSHSMT